MNLANDSGLGTSIKLLRNKRGISIRQMADQSGVGRSTLSRWEADACTPSVPELDRLLAALNTTPEDRVELLSKLNSTQAKKALKDSTAITEVHGTFLRALRLRQNLSQQRVAELCLVRTATVSRWENGERSLPLDKFLDITSALGATPEEIQALESVNTVLKTEFDSLDAIEQKVQDLRSRIAFGEYHLIDLQFILMQSALWPKALRSEAAKELLIVTRAAYAEWLMWWWRIEEAHRCIQPHISEVNKYRSLPVWGRIYRCSGIYNQEVLKVEPKKLGHNLASTLEILEGQPSEAFVQRELSGLYLQCGNPTQAVTTLNQSRNKQSGEDPTTHALCCDLSESSIALKEGKFDRAHTLMPTTPTTDHYLNVCRACVTSEIAVKEKQINLAQATLLKAHSQVHGKGLWHFEAELTKSLQALQPSSPPPFLSSTRGQGMG